MSGAAMASEERDVGEYVADPPVAGTACAWCRVLGHFCPAKGYVMRAGDGEAVCRECGAGEVCGQQAAMDKLANGYKEFEADDDALARRDPGRVLARLRSVALAVSAAESQAGKEFSVKRGGVMEMMEKTQAKREALQMRGLGMSSYQIAKRVGYSPAAVDYWWKHREAGPAEAGPRVEHEGAPGPSAPDDKAKEAGNDKAKDTVAVAAEPETVTLRVSPAAIERMWERLSWQEKVRVAEFVLSS